MIDRNYQIKVSNVSNCRIHARSPVCPVYRVLDERLPGWAELREQPKLSPGTQVEGSVGIQNRYVPSWAAGLGWTRLGSTL